MLFWAVGIASVLVSQAAPLQGQRATIGSVSDGKDILKGKSLRHICLIFIQSLQHLSLLFWESTKRQTERRDKQEMHSHIRACANISAVPCRGTQVDLQAMGIKWQPAKADPQDHPQDRQAAPLQPV